MPCPSPRLLPHLLPRLLPRLLPALPLLLAPCGASAAGSRDPVATRALTCPALKALVAREGNVVLAASEFVYETVHRDSGACRLDETARPAFEPTADERACFAGWRCTQRAGEPGEK